MRWENILIKFIGALLFSYSLFYVIGRKMNALTSCVQSGACASTTPFTLEGYLIIYLLLAAIGLTLLVCNFFKEE